MITVRLELNISSTYQKILTGFVNSQTKTAKTPIPDKIRKLLSKLQLTKNWVLKVNFSSVRPLYMYNHFVFFPQKLSMN